jgi:hypothetical protein
LSAVPKTKTKSQGGVVGGVDRCGCRSSGSASHLCSPSLASVQVVDRVTGVACLGGTWNEILPVIGAKLLGGTVSHLLQWGAPVMGPGGSFLVSLMHAHLSLWSTVCFGHADQ